MVSLILTWLIIAWGALACIYMLRCAWVRFPKRDVDVDDVVPFLYPWISRWLSHFSTRPPNLNFAGNLADWSFARPNASGCACILK